MSMPTIRWRSITRSPRPGADLGLRPFGMRAMMSLRLDKFFGSWLHEYSPDYLPAETGLDRFVAYDKGADFIGKAAAREEKQAGPARKICAFIVDADDADAVAYEPIWIDGKVEGFVTSGGYSHFAGTSVALGFVPSERIADGLAVEIEILGRHAAGAAGDDAAVRCRWCTHARLSGLRSMAGDGAAWWLNNPDLVPAGL